MAVVVDASAIGAIMFGEPEGPMLVAHLEGETLLAPGLLDYELTNLAWKKARKRPASLPQVFLSLQAALALPVVADRRYLAQRCSRWPLRLASRPTTPATSGWHAPATSNWSRSTPHLHERRVTPSAQ